MQKLTRFNSFIHSFKFIRNMKMQTQTFILQSFIFVLVFIIIFCSQMINQNMMDNLIQSLTKEIDTRTNIKQLNIQSQFIKIQAHYPIDQGFKFLQGFNRLNQLNLELQSFSLQQLQRCESQEASFQYYSTIPLFCFKLCKDSTQNSSNISLINHINGYYSLLNSIFLPISLSEFQKTMFFTFLTDQEYFAILPPKIVPDQYFPSDRSWYQKQEQQIIEKNKNDTQVISDIYQDFETKKYEFTLTIGLTDQQNNRQGIFGIDQTLEHYKELLLYQDLNIVVVDLKGRMLLSNLIVEQTIDLSVEEKYIYEKNITGFDQDDWNEMIQEAIKQGHGISECQIFGGRKQFCRYNSLFQQNLIIIVINIKSNFYLLVFQSLAHITIDLDYAATLQNDIFQKFQEFLFYYLGAGFFLLVISLMIIPIFFKPFRNIQKIVQTQMASKYTIHYEHLFFSNRKKNHLSFFQESFNVFKQKLLDFAQSKSQDCYLFENFKYPISCKIITKDLAHFINTQINMQTIINLPSQNTYPPTVFFDSSAITSQKSLKSNRQLSPKDVTFRMNFQNIQYDN